MKNEIRILMVEDSSTDAELVRHALRQGGLSFVSHRVQTREEFVEQIDSYHPDLILSDFSLPAFDGFTALSIAIEQRPDLPFIFVTGTLGEELAIDTLKKGATDYVLKHRLSRLVPSVHRAMREKKERSERHHAEDELRKSHEQLRALSVYLQYVREEERIRIAREVHDELGQALTGLKLKLIWLTSRLPKNSKALRDQARSMSTHINQIIHAVRRISTELRPGVLDTAGLVAAIEWQAHEFEQQTGIRCRMHSDLADTISDQDLNTAFFRIFQETLTNVIRHAKATRVEVKLFEKEHALLLEVKDNGRGISDAQIHNTKSIGLLGIRERAALLGGEVQWQGQPGKGTTVTVRIPRPDNSVEKPKLITHEDTAHRRPRRRASRLEANSR